MNLINAEIGVKYTIKEIPLDDEELKSFLFSLGCFSGETITVISKDNNSIIISLKDARYNIDKDLASFIDVE